MPHLSCTEPVCRHEWTETANPEMPRCPRCGGFWVRATRDAWRPGRAAGAGSRRHGRLLARSGALAGR